MENLWPRLEPLLLQVEKPARYAGSEWVAGAGRGSADAAAGGFDLCERGSRQGVPDRAGKDTSRPGASCHPLASDAAAAADAAADDAFAFCMMYPDTYEVGQSNEAVRILCNAVNATAGLRAERGFLPAPDLIALMRAEGLPLFSLERCAPVREFPVVGITLPHELCATNVLEMLDVAGIPLHADARGEGDPFVVGGGPCAFNPEPFAPFFDIFSIGEGEESLPELLCALRDCRARGASRAETLDAVARIAGVYVPALWERDAGSGRMLPLDPAYADARADGADRADGQPVVLRRVFEGFAQRAAWEPCVVPFAETVHDRLNVEVLRGCTRGCRFCQAGMMYRPVRERSADNVVQSVLAGLAATGYDEVSLTSLSTTDHSGIADILTRLNEACAGTGTRISLPSQRLDAFGVDMARLVAGGKKGGLTFAPEAGTQRLRDVINKNVTEDDLYGAVDAAVHAGWRRVKLYFMIGLPTETDEDLAGVAQLARGVYERARDACPPAQRGAIKVGVSLAIFVPKAHTPFQYCPQIPADEAQRRVGLVKRQVGYKAIDISWHNSATSFIEAVMSRGDRRAAAWVEAAWRAGARFDAWSELFRADAWETAARETGFDPTAVAHRACAPDDPLPWEHISTGVSQSYFVREYERALREGEDGAATTPDCSFGTCTACGACDALGLPKETGFRR